MERPGNYEAQAAADLHPCSCFPGEGPVPCQRKHAMRDCWRMAVLRETQENIVALKNMDRNVREQILLDYMMRVRNCLEM